MEKTKGWKKTKMTVAPSFQDQMPWLDLRVSEDAMDHLWDSINCSTQLPAKVTLAGNISKSRYIQDKDNLFYEGALKELSEYLYLKDWNNYYNIRVVKAVPFPPFKLHELWVNYQKQHEFNPPHTHNGGIGFSFVVFMKIPTHWKEQHALPMSANSNSPCASDFMFSLGRGQGKVEQINIRLCPEDAGRMLFFPAWVTHQVFPFYGQPEEERITISGNIITQEDDTIPSQDKESQIEFHEKQARSLREMIEKEDRK